MNAHDLSILSMISDASLLAQAVMALLLVISLVSWTIIFRKLFAIKAAQRATNRFEEKFWQGAELNALYQEVSHASKDPGPMARIFEAGMKEFRRARQNGITGNGGPESSNIGPCVPPSSVKWTPSNPRWPFWPRPARSAPTSACSAPSGAS